MAAVVTSDNNLTYFSFPIEKKEDTEAINPVDGTPDVIIWGKATDGTVDSDRQIVDPVWSAAAIQKWLATGGNIRQAHDPKKPVGKGMHVEITPDGHYVKSLIADPLAKHFIRTGVLNDYSVGISNPKIRYGHDKALDPGYKAVNGIITGHDDDSSSIAEISVVDRGSNYGTKFQLAGKSAGGGGAEFVGKMYAPHALVTKSATPALVAASNLVELADDEELVTVSLPKSASINFSPASLYKLLEHKRIAEEREAATAEKTAAAGPQNHSLEHVREGNLPAGSPELEQAAARFAAAEAAKAAQPDPDGDETGDPDPDGGAQDEDDDQGDDTDQDATGTNPADKTADPEIAKRDFDPNVGGGVDRDKLPAASFVFPNTRTFPVVTPADVKDASESWGRYEGPKSHEEFKKRLIALAKSKGAAFVAQLPKAWKDEMNDDSTKAAEPEPAATVAEPTQATKAFDDNGAGDGGAVDHVNPADAPVGADPGDESDDAPDGKPAPKARAKAAKTKAGKKPKGGKPFPGAAAPFDGKDTDGDGEDADTAKPGKNTKPAKAGSAGKSAADTEIRKTGGKDCTNCGRTYHADSKMKRCETCNTKLPKADKHHAPQLAKAATKCACGTGMDTGHNFCPNCGAKAPQAEKAAASCTCGLKFAADERYCPACGTARTTTTTTKAADPGATPEQDDVTPAAHTATADKSVQSTEAGHRAKESQRARRGSPTPGDGVTETCDEEPVPEHREPDGPYIEAFEADNGIPTMPDDEVRTTKTVDDVSTLLKAAGEPLDLLAIHDLTCPAYHPDTAAKAHPYGLEALDTHYWENKALTLAAEGSLAEGRRAGVLWQTARTIKAADPTLVYQICAEQHQAFKNANDGVLEGPGSYPHPGEIHPGSFRHPYLSAGHAADSPGHDAPNTAKVPVEQITATEFQRGPLLTGHGADSPGNPTPPPSPVPSPGVTGSPGRVFYTNGARDSAREAMAAMHDHIANTFPDLCPLHGPGYAGEKPVGARPVPTPAGVSTPAQAPATKTTAEPAATAATGQQPESEVAKTDTTAGHTAPSDEQVRKAMQRVWTGEITLDQARTDLGLTPIALPGTGDITTVPALGKTANPATLPKAAEADAIKTAVAEATAPLIARLEAGTATDPQVAALAKAIATQNKTLKKHSKLLDAIASQPDPIAPLRGAGMTRRPEAPADPEGPLTVNKRAALAEETQVTEWLRTFRDDPDPSRREVAWRELNRMYETANQRTT